MEDGQTTCYQILLIRWFISPVEMPRRAEIATVLSLHNALRQRHCAALGSGVTPY